jgi:preprotein translocase subunit SecE
MVGTGGARLKRFAPQPIQAARLEEGRDGGAGRRKTATRDMAKANPGEFIQQVRSEGAKVTWPTRKETMITTAMVFVMVILASIFFLVTDQALRYVVGLVLGIGR